MWLFGILGGQFLLVRVGFRPGLPDCTPRGSSTGDRCSSMIAFKEDTSEDGNLVIEHSSWFRSFRCFSRSPPFEEELLMQPPPHVVHFQTIPPRLKLLGGKNADRQSADIQFPHAVDSVQLDILMIDVIFRTITFFQSEKKERKETKKKNNTVSYDIIYHYYNTPDKDS
jgi:hypothetical protein